MKLWEVAPIYIFAFIIVFSIPLYRIYKYGWNGYLEQRAEKRRRGAQAINNLFS